MKPLLLLVKTCKSKLCLRFKNPRRFIAGSVNHDVSTITHYAYDRVRQGQTMPGVIEVNLDAPISRVIEDILVLTECSQEGELEGQVQYLPW
jgi:hypothetical protein